MPHVYMYLVMPGNRFEPYPALSSARIPQYFRKRLSWLTPSPLLESDIGFGRTSPPRPSKLAAASRNQLGIMHHASWGTRKDWFRSISGCHERNVNVYGLSTYPVAQALGSCHIVRSDSDRVLTLVRVILNARCAILRVNFHYDDRKSWGCQLVFTLPMPLCW